MGDGKDAQGVTADETIALPEIGVRHLRVTIANKQGSSLIVHRFSEKSKKMMADKMGKKATGPRKARKPKDLYEQSLYFDADGNLAIPGDSLRCVAIAAAEFAGVPVEMVKAGLFIVEEYPRIYGRARQREDHAVNRGYVRDLRIRAEFIDWRVAFTVEYDPALLTAQQICALYQRAGFSIGICDWRPERRGAGRHGRFELKDVKSA